MHLALEIAQNRIIGAVLNENTVSNERSHLFVSSNESGKKEELIAFIAQFGDLSNFEYLSCLVNNTPFTLIPNALFDVQHASEQLQFATTTPIDKKELDYVRLSIAQLVAVYTIPNWIKSSIIPKFPRAVFQHALVPMLRRMLQLSSAQSELSCVIHDDFAHFTVIRLGDIQWATTLPVDAAEDILYHFITAIEKGGIQKERIRLFAQGDKAKTWLTTLTSYQHSIESLKHFQWIESTDSPFTIHQFCE